MPIGRRIAGRGRADERRGREVSGDMWRGRRRSATTAAGEWEGMQWRQLEMQDELRRSRSSMRTRRRG